MKYRVTTRGWFVFSILGILLIFSIGSLINGYLQKPDTVNNTDSPMENNAVITTETDTAENNGEEIEVSEEVIEETEISETIDNTTEVTDDTTESTDDTTESVNPVEIDFDMRSQILFDKNIFDLNSSYITTLEEWLNILNEDDNLEITIEGHINGYPYYEDGEFGLALALSRATIISDYFVSNGISERRITLINMGSNEQVDMSDAEENHYLNRRAVIYFTKKP